MSDKEPRVPFWQRPLKGVSKIIALTFVAAFVSLCLFIGGKAYRQGRSVDAAGKHADLLATLVGEYPSFSNLVAHGQSSSPEGFVWVKGTLESQAQFNDLKQLIISSSPPVMVVCRIEVAGADTSWEFEPEK